MILWIIGLAAAVGVVVVVAWRKRADPNWRPLLPGLVGTVVGAVVSLAAYLWVFEQSRCSGREDVACMLNQNQGMLTFLTVILAVAAIWVAALNRHHDQRARRRAARLRASVALTSALDEIAHNLIHVSLAHHGTTSLHAVPQISISEVSNVCAQEFRLVLNPEIVSAAQNMCRNVARVEGAKGVPRAEHHVQSIVNNSLTMLVLSTKYHPSAAEPIVSQPGFQDFRELAKVDGVWVGFRSSQAEPDAAELRSNDVPILCWFDDDAPQKVVAYPQSIRFADMNHPSH
jgi:hypothetical protein